MRYTIMKEMNKITFTARKADMNKLIQNFLALAFTNFEQNGKKKLVETSTMLLEGSPEEAMSHLTEYVEEIEEYRDHLKAVYELIEEHLFLESSKISISFPAGEKIPMDEINAKMVESAENNAEKKKKVKAKIKSKKSKEEK